MDPADPFSHTKTRRREGGEAIRVSPTFSFFNFPFSLPPSGAMLGGRKKGLTENQKRLRFGTMLIGSFNGKKIAILRSPHAKSRPPAF